MSLLALALCAAPAAASEPPTLRDFSSVRAAGMAGAARGYASGNEAILLNPAAMALTPRFNWGLSALYDNPNGTRFWGFDAVDSVHKSLDVLSGGIGYYAYASGHGPERRRGTLGVLALATPLSESLFVGGSAKWLDLDGAVDTNAVTADAAATLKLGSHVLVSAIGQNLIDVGNDEARRSYGAGAALLLGQLLADVDWKLEPDRTDAWVHSFALGAEYLFGNRVAPRLGFAWDGVREKKQAAVGVSLVAMGAVFEAAYRLELGGTGHQISVGLRTFKLPAE